MKVIWKVRAWSKEKDFFDRYLEVVPEAVAPFEKHRLLYVLEQRNHNARALKPLRQLFKEIEGSIEDRERPQAISVFCLPDYFEDVDGREISLTKIFQQKHDNTNLVSVPGHLREHDLQLMFSENSDLPREPERIVNLSQAELDCLTFFVRDANELEGSAYQRSNAPSLQGHAGFANCVVHNYSEEEIRSFVTIFRRLYMKNEPGNFECACKTYAKHFLNKRVTKWVEAELADYKRFLDRSCGEMVLGTSTYGFTIKLLLDIFIYTRYAHQPSEDRIRQFNTCLADVGNENKLFWLFCCALRYVGVRYLNVLQFIKSELKWYIARKAQTPSIECRPLIDGTNPGHKRLVDVGHYDRFLEHSARYAADLMSEDHAPSDALPEYLNRAKKELSAGLAELGITV